MAENGGVGMGSSVFKLSHDITSFNTNAFKPYVTSFGPYHHNERHLQPMEAHKLRSLNRFLNLTNLTLECVVGSFQPIKQQLMNHYDQLGDEWRGGNCFLELMIRDGCFMLDILRSTIGYAVDYSPNDPVLGLTPQSNLLREKIRRDLMLIENQLPLLVLYTLIADNQVVLDNLRRENMEAGEIREEFIRKQIHALISEYFKVFRMNIQSHEDLCLHALDVFRENMIWGPIKRPIQRAVIPKFPAATALSYTGVTFLTNHTASLADITFENGFLTLPCIAIGKETETLFLNLMAFERFQTSIAKELSAYIDFMNSLVRSVKDVSFLRSMGIIWSTLEVSDKAIVALFHKLAKNQIIDTDDSLHDVRWDLHKHYEDNFRKGWWNHCNERLAEWGSNFRQTHFKTPWTVIGLVAGIILLIFSAVQTIYAVLSYDRKED